MKHEQLDILKQLLQTTNSIEQLKLLKIEFLGKKSYIINSLKELGTIKDIEHKKSKGEEINNLKVKIENLIEEKFQILEEEQLKEKLAQNSLDLTLPARSVYQSGSIHPVTQAIEELVQIFSNFGFCIKEGPNIENDWYNFTALNIAEHHPARQMHDTFYLKNGNLLRTHTSPIQIKELEKNNLPIYIIAPGRTYRSDSDVTHTPMFHQIEVLAVDKNLNMANLKYVVIKFIQQFFETTDIEIRFRPSFFPFTEPSAEVDIKISGTNKWLEILGCGMVHPNVLKNCNVDHNHYSGFAIGLGVERMAMLKYGIKDLRQFFDNDIRWLKHYSFNALDIPSLIGGLTK